MANSGKSWEKFCSQLFQKTTMNLLHLWLTTECSPLEAGCRSPITKTWVCHAQSLFGAASPITAFLGDYPAGVSAVTFWYRC
jgi:hypothetical protein